MSALCAWSDKWLPLPGLPARPKRLLQKLEGSYHSLPIPSIELLRARKTGKRVFGFGLATECTRGDSSPPRFAGRPAADAAGWGQLSFFEFSARVYLTYKRMFV